MFSTNSDPSHQAHLPTHEPSVSPSVSANAGPGISSGYSIPHAGHFPYVNYTATPYYSNGYYLSDYHARLNAVVSGTRYNPGPSPDPGPGPTPLVNAGSEGAGAGSGSNYHAYHPVTCCCPACYARLEAMARYQQWYQQYQQYQVNPYYQHQNMGHSFIPQQTYQPQQQHIYQSQTAGLSSQATTLSNTTTTSSVVISAEAPMPVPAPDQMERKISGSMLSVTVSKPAALLSHEGAGQTIKFEVNINTVPMDTKADDDEKSATISIDLKQLTFPKLADILQSSSHAMDNDEFLVSLYARLLCYAPVQTRYDNEPFTCIISPTDKIKSTRLVIEPIFVNSSKNPALDINSKYYISLIFFDHQSNEKLLYANIYEDKPLEITYLFNETHMAHAKELADMIENHLKPYTKTHFERWTQHKRKREGSDDKKSQPAPKTLKNSSEKRIRIKFKESAATPKEETDTASASAIPQKIQQPRIINKYTKKLSKEDKKPLVDQITFLTRFHNELGKSQEPAFIPALRALVESTFPGISSTRFQKTLRTDTDSKDNYTYEEHSLWLNWSFRTGDQAILLVVKGLNKGEITTLEFFMGAKLALRLQYLTPTQSKFYSDPSKNPSGTYFGIQLLSTHRILSNSRNWIICVNRELQSYHIDLLNLVSHFYANPEFSPYRVHFVDLKCQNYPELRTMASNSTIQKLYPLLEKSIYQSNTYSFKYTYKHIQLDMHVSRASKFHSWYLTEKAWLARYQHPNTIGQSYWVIKVFGKTITKKKKNEILNFTFSHRWDEIELHDVHAEPIPYQVPGTQSEVRMSGNEAINLFYELNNTYFKIKNMSLCDESRLEAYRCELTVGISIERHGIYLKLMNALTGNPTWYQSKFKGLTLFQGKKETAFDGISDQDNARRDNSLKALQQLPIKEWYNLLKAEENRATQANVELAKTIIKDTRFIKAIPDAYKTKIKENPESIFDIFKDGANLKLTSSIQKFNDYRSQYILNQESIDKPLKLKMLVEQSFNISLDSKDNADSLETIYTLQNLAQQLWSKSKASKNNQNNTSQNLYHFHDLLYDEVMINRLDFSQMADKEIRGHVFELTWNSRFWHCQIYEEPANGAANDQSHITPGLGLLNP